MGKGDVLNLKKAEIKAGVWGSGLLVGFYRVP